MQRHKPVQYAPQSRLPRFGLELKVKLVQTHNYHGTLVVEGSYTGYIIECYRFKLGFWAHCRRGLSLGGKKAGGVSEGPG